MKINKITKYLLAATLFAGMVSCDNPLKDFNLQISTEVIKNTATLKIVDNQGNPIPGATVALLSGEVQNIYNTAGKKDFKVVDGLVTFGLDPNIDVSASTLVRFRVEVKATGYITQVVPVVITNVSTGLNTVTLVKPTQVPETGGVEEVQVNVELSANGSTLTATAVQVPALNPGEPQMTLNIPAGTQFKDANGNIIVGGSLSVSIGAFDPENEDIEALLPGGGLTADEVELPGGRKAAGTFSAAGITQINMVVNGVAIRQFSQPIVVGLPLPAYYVSPLTGMPIQAGQSFDLFSNSPTGDAKWKFEKAVTVSGSAASGYMANFTTDHLTFFMAAEFGEACTTGLTVKFSGDWMNNGTTYPVLVEAVWGGKTKYSRQHSISLASNTILLEDLPSSGLKLRFKKVTGEVIYESTVANCGQETMVVLPNPNTPTDPMVTLQLYVRCPNKGIITVLPTFQMHYKKSGTTDAYAFLGEVENGLLRTSLLQTNGTKYDFKAHYGNNKVKTVLNKTVNADNNATAGIQPGDIIGEKAGATNLAILTEECNKL